MDWTTGLERKLRAGADHRWRIWLPLPALDVPAPTLEARYQAGPVSIALSRLRASVAVSAVGSDRRSLTVPVGTGAASRGLMGDRGGRAWLSLGAEGQIPVSVLRVEGDTLAVLADPLPHPVGAAATGTLSWETWTALLPLAAWAPAALRERYVPWTVVWSSQVGTDAPSEAHRIEGILHVVRQPFGTGLSDSQLLALVSPLGGGAPRSQSSWAPQIAQAEQELVRWLRGTMRALGCEHEEDAVMGLAYQQVHAYLAASLVLAAAVAAGANLAEPRDYYRARAEDDYRRVNERVPWVDCDGDGNAEAGETGLAVGGVVRRLVGGLFDGDPDYDPASFRRAGLEDDR